MADDQPPPSYEAATSSSAPAVQPQPQHHALHHRARNGIPAQRRRSMEDEARPLPAGWIRQFDAATQHQFFVDTRATPQPRSIWHHPYDDEAYLASLPPGERESIARMHRSISLEDIAAESSGSDDDDGGDGDKKKTKAGKRAAGGAGGGADAGAAADDVHGLHKLGRRIKDRITHSDHAQRVAQRERRAEAERRAYAAHLAARRALAQAIQTGRPQLLGKDRDGKDVYVLPPQQDSSLFGARGAYGYNPYGAGPFTAGPTSDARYLRPQAPYARPYGYGYGGGYGFPLAGGILGGAMLGSLLF